MLLLLASLTALPAHADSITLDTGATIEGDLARYEFGGDCQLSVTEGELSGVILIVPCHRVQSFMRTAVRTPVPIGLEEEALQVSSAGSDAPPAVVGVPAVVDAPAASEPVGAAVAAEASPSEDDLFYDEPLFPPDDEPTAAAPPSRAAPSMAPSAPNAPTGPRMAPRMDEPASSTERRSVSF
jgi:hypothetical protein